MPILLNMTADGYFAVYYGNIIEKYTCLIEARLRMEALKSYYN